MWIEKNECVSCPQGCIDCGNKHVNYSKCDICGQYCKTYDVYGLMMCIDCAIRKMIDNEDIEIVYKYNGLEFSDSQSLARYLKNHLNESN